MKLTIIAALTICLAACNNANTGSNADKYTSPDTTAFPKGPVDTFKTDTESATSGPDNAPPNKSDSNSYQVNKPAQYNNSRGGK
jgi:hypothetical protein